MKSLRSARRAGLLALFVLAVGASAPDAQTLIHKKSFVKSDGHTRIADPKLDGGGARAAFHLSAGAANPLSLRADVHDTAGFLKTLWTGTLTPGGPGISLFWDGTDAVGDYVDTGDYWIVVVGSGGTPTHLKLPIDVVRLGITEVEFRDSAAGNDEWPMVYFMKNGVHSVFYSTPSIHEYANITAADVSDVDLNDGDPRPAVALHTATDEPIMNGSSYATEHLNYPLAYERGASPRLAATMGDGGTTVGGASMSSNYPVSGYSIRARVEFPGVTAFSGALTPGAQFVVDGSALPNDVSRTDWTIRWKWEYSANGTSWITIPGKHETDHRFYTIWDDPIFQPGVVGTQYDGPWVEVADYVSSWSATLGISTATDAGLMEAFVKGFVGQNGGIATPIENVIYDSVIFGGGYGGNQYMGWNPGDPMELSALLNAAANGPYVNCSDNMASQTTMLSMLGLPGLQPVKLGSMNPLNAIWGIGAPSYTTDLWGNGTHQFAWHHIATRNGGVDVSDTCLQVDEDGTPGATPGLPGWNADRPWAGVNGYDDLSCPNPVSATVESLIPSLL